MAAGATYEPIATTTVSNGTTTSIVFSSLGSYTDIRLVFVGGNAGGSPLCVQFNSDTGTNYSTTNLLGSGSAVTSARSTNKSFARLSWVQYNDLYKVTFADIFSYSGSTNKTILSQYAGDNNGSGYVDRGVSLWRSTSAITSITLLNEFSDYFTNGSKASIYGIKAA